MPNAETDPERSPLPGLRMLILALLGAAAALAVGAAASNAASDPPSYQGCISSDSDVAGCTPISGAAAGGEGTGLDGLTSLAISADGESVYAASSASDAVARFDRDPATGALTFTDCISSDNDTSGCTPIPVATASGTHTGLDQLTSLAVSADGGSVYTASYEGDAVARFDRDPGTGELAYEDCISSDSDVDGCAPIPGATAFGVGTGLDGLFSVAVSADGGSVYTASNRSDAVARFDRDPSTGELAYEDCISSDSNVAGCTPIPGATPFGVDTGLDALFSVAVSADGGSVYAASELGDAVAHFDRDPSTGELAYEDCISSDSEVGGCAPIPGAVADGTGTGLDALFSVAVSADGASVYTASYEGDAVARFDRDPGTGELAYEDCISSDSEVGGCAPIPGATAFGVGTGLDGLFSVAVSADGERVYAASFDGDAVARFDRDVLTGALTYEDCSSSNADVGACTPIPGATSGGTNTGLDALRAVAVSAGGESIYAASFDGDAVARFDRDPAEPAPNQFSFVKLTRNRRRGTARLTVRVPASGRLILAGPGVRRASRATTGPGPVALPVVARGRAAKQLRRRGTVRVSARVTYTPDGGAPRTKAKRIKLVRRR